MNPYYSVIEKIVEGFLTGLTFVTMNISQRIGSPLVHLPAPVTFKVSQLALPITYQWYVDKGIGPTPISVVSNPSAGSDLLVLANLQLTNAGIYTLAATNSVGGPVSSSTSTLTVPADPGPPATGTYGAMILSNNPVAYWRLNETNDPSTGVLPTYDASGHNFDGLYGLSSENGFNGIQGPQSPTLPVLKPTARRCSHRLASRIRGLPFHQSISAAIR